MPLARKPRTLAADSFRSEAFSMRDPVRPTALRPLLVFVFFVATTISAVSAQTPALAIKGYDPVAYFTTGKPTPGLPQFKYEWGGHSYYFSRSDHLERFKANPARYAPQFGNYCAMALSKGELVMADPENWLISDGKLYVFGKPAPAGPALFQKDLSANIARAEQNRPLTLQH
jgi:YHS domain-containing protein